jgi:Amt family ammonium transporter
MEKSSADILWILTSSALVFVMRAGFAMLESGLVRSKNSINVTVKVLTDLGISLMVFWPFGFALMFGSSFHGLFGITLFSPHFTQVWPAVFFLFHAMFVSTSATIMSGAVAERIRYSSYVVITLLFSSLIYPVFGHWAWGNAPFGGDSGWLSKLGFVDFAGSTVVHSVGGWISAAVLLVLGPRAGRYNEDGSVNRVTGSNTQNAVIGTILLWFGWFGFNGGSTLAMNGDVPAIIVKTSLAGASGLVVTLGAGWRLRGYADVGCIVNGALAGLVAITASCAYVTEFQSIIIGAAGGAVMLFTEWFLDRLRIDDAVGAIPVHLGAGLWGTVAAGIFGDLALMKTGNGRIAQIGVQLLGAAAAAVWAFGVAYIIIRIINRISPIRVSADDELRGLNTSEHRASTEIYDLSAVLEQQSRTGDLSLRAPVEPFSEAGQIAARYNSVIANLESNLIAKSDYLGILDNVTDGLFLLDRENRVSSHYSAAMEKIFCRDSLSSVKFDSLLEGMISDKDLASFREYCSLLFDGTVSERTLSRLNPLSEKEIFIDDKRGGFTSKHLAMTFIRISEGNEIKRVMGIVRDVTAETELSQEMEKTKDRRQSEMEMFYRILHVEPDMFIEFINGFEENLTRINGILEKSEGNFAEMLDEIFSCVHAVKGDASLFELDFLAQKAHSFEEKIASLKNRRELVSSDFLPLAVSLSELQSSAVQMRTLVEQIASFQKNFVSHNGVGDEMILLSVNNAVKTAASKAGKSVRVESDSFEILSIPKQQRRRVREALVQLARNAVVHGIEDPSQRRAEGKSETGTVNISARKNESEISITFRDDGAGIDFDKLKEKAAAAAGEHPQEISRESLIEMIFSSGFSTAGEVGMDAGRGVGLYLVKRIMAEIGGRISVRTKKGTFCEFELIIPAEGVS